MFHIVEKNQKLVKAIMIILGATFILWGVGGYLGMGTDDGYVAQVGDQKIYLRDIDNATNENPQSTDKMQILFSLINRQLFLNNIQDKHLVATKEQLQQEIASIPLFQENGKFNLNKYKVFLQSHNLSAVQFQNNIQKQILLNQEIDFFKNSYFSSELFKEKFNELLSRERNVSSYTINPQQFYSQISLNESEIDSHYKQNIAIYTSPEQVKLQYLELSQDEVAQSINIENKDIDKYIAQHSSTSNDNQINASHILFAVPESATNEVKAAIKEKAQSILIKLKEHPTEFKKYALKYSQDKGSAKNGGNLGFFNKGIMVKQFDEVAFKMKPGQISDLVETPYGYHILKLNAIRKNDTQAMRNFVKVQLQNKEAAIQLQKRVEQLKDITYNQSNNLESAAKQLNLPIQTSDWVIKNEIKGEFSTDKVQKAIFNADVIKNHNNSEVVEISKSNYKVFKVIDYRQEKVLPLSVVRDKVEMDLKSQKANNLVSMDGQAKIAKLNQGALQLNFTNAQNVSLLAQTDSISPVSVKQIFNANISKLPSYTGIIDSKGEFIIYKINSEYIDKDLLKQNHNALNQLDKNSAMLDLASYLNYLKTKYTVNYKVDRLNLQK